MSQTTVSNINQYARLIEILIDSDNIELAKSVLEELRDRGDDVSQLEAKLDPIEADR